MFSDRQFLLNGHGVFRGQLHVLVSSSAFSVKIFRLCPFTIDLTFVESLVSETSTYTGTVLLCELRDTMQTYIRNGLLRGCKVSVRGAFEYAWSELVVSDISSDDSISQR